MCIRDRLIEFIPQDLDVIGLLDDQLDRYGQGDCLAAPLGLAGEDIRSHGRMSGVLPGESSAVHQRFHVRRNSIPLAGSAASLSNRSGGTRRAVRSSTAESILSAFAILTIFSSAGTSRSASILEL